MKDEPAREEKSGWVATLMKPFNRPGNSNVEPVKAYLGDELAYHFDKSLNQWVTIPETGAGSSKRKKVVIQDDSSSSSSNSDDCDSDSDSDTSDGESRVFYDPQEGNTPGDVQESETVIIQAIEAAHLAKSLIANGDVLKDSTSVGNASSGHINHHYAHSPDLSLNPSVSRRMSRPKVSASLAHEFDSADSGGSGSGEMEPMSIQMLLFIISFQYLTTSMYYGLLFILPAYCLTPSSSGGLNYTLMDLGLVMSCAGFILYSVSLLKLQAKVSLLLKCSPVRCARIALGLLSICCLLLPLLCSSNRAADSGLKVHLEVDTNRENYPQHLESLQQPQVTDLYWYKFDWSFNAVIMFPFYVLYALFYYTPCQSLFGLFVPSVLIAVMVTGGYLGRRASMILVWTILQQSTFEPSSIHVLYDFIDQLAAVIVSICS